MILLNAQINPEDYILIILVILVVAIPLIAWISISLRDFCNELRFLNLEISRNTGEERRYYMKRRKRLWLSLIPFVRY